MDLLTKDVLFNIATMLDLDNLLSFCNSDPRINRLICQGEAIWNFKLVKEFPDYKSHFNQRGRKAYELLIALTKLKKEFRYEGTIYELYKETKLNLSTKALTSLPPEIGKLSNLQTLYSFDNQITTLPPEIGKLSNLQTLSLSSNQITTLPLEIGNLSKLRTLFLYKNQIKILPPEIGKLTQLQTLSLDYNQIKILPPEIGNLSNLQYLFLDNNQIKILPPEIGKLSNLQDLHLDKSVIIPPGLKLPITYF